MSILKRCQDYYERRLGQFGYPPTKIMMFQWELDMLVAELKDMPMFPCKDGEEIGNQIMGMDIIVLGDRMKSNGCNEDGWDLYEQQTREAFEFIACRTGFSLKRDEECPWIYAETNTQDCWRMFHNGHVKGRSWNHWSDSI